MKKFLNVMLASLMLVVFAACSKTPADNKATATPGASAPAAGTPTGTTSGTTATPSQDPTEAPTQAPDGMPVPDMIQFIINEDGTATNGVADGPDIRSYGASRTVSVDEATGMNIVTLGGGGNIYNASLEDYYNDMRTGFTLEYYFMATSLPATSYYGIVDNCEAGGFGAELHNAGNGNGIVRWNIHLDGAYYLFDYEIELNKWYHFVHTWDENYACTYVNGELVDDYESDWAFIAFTNIATAKYLAIGGCCSGNVPGGQGMIGSIGICNMYSDAITAAQVAMLYQNIINPGAAE